MGQDRRPNIHSHQQYLFVGVTFIAHLYKHKMLRLTGTFEEVLPYVTLFFRVLYPKRGKDHLALRLPDKTHFRNNQKQLNIGKMYLVNSLFINL